MTVGSALGAAVLTVWLAAGKVIADTRGAVILWSIPAFLALEATLHVRTWLRSPRPSGGP